MTGIDEENPAWMDLVWAVQKLNTILCRAFGIDEGDL